MDYSYFHSAPQPYHYYGLPPTPVVTQPMDMESFPNGQSSQSAPFQSPFATFHDSFQYDPRAFMHPTAPQPLSQAPSRAPSRALTHAPSSISPAITSFEHPVIASTERPGPAAEHPHMRSSSEERETLNPQQRKRKAQNRAAQRAFRDRKEKHLKDIEAKLEHLQQKSMSDDSEKERLRKEIARMAAEIEILRATSHAQPSIGEPDEDFGPLGYTASKYASDREDVASKVQMHGNIATIVIDDSSGELLLNSSQTWDYIQAHQSFRNGLIDIGDAIERLKKLARCDGQGPVFRESDILKVIEESAVAGGRDELI